MANCFPSSTAVWEFSLFRSRPPFLRRRGRPAVRDIAFSRFAASNLQLFIARLPAAAARRERKKDSSQEES